MKKFSMILLTASITLAFSACGGKKDDASGGDKDGHKGGDMKSHKRGGDEDFNKPDLEEKDLSSAGEAFKGWFAKGPKEADVMGDLGGVRIATKKVRGPNSFDLAWAFKKPDFTEMKANIAKGDEVGKSKTTYTVDTAEALEWTTEYEHGKSMHFSITFEVSGQVVNCYTMPMGVKNAERFAFLKETCKSIVKK
ncbi:hypothetical protein KJ975_08270 [Myxococcota bacterium]|nr:hypothetical protein [Myxococcota bacterium]